MSTSDCFQHEKEQRIITLHPINLHIMSHSTASIIFDHLSMWWPCWPLWYEPGPSKNKAICYHPNGHDGPMGKQHAHLILFAQERNMNNICTSICTKCRIHLWRYESWTPAPCQATMGQVFGPLPQHVRQKSIKKEKSEHFSCRAFLEKTQSF